MVSLAEHVTQWTNISSDEEIIIIDDFRADSM